MLSGMPPTVAGAGATMGGAFFLPRATSRTSWTSSARMGAA
jgi:hypothetical protein